MPSPRKKPNGVYTLIVCYQRKRRQLTLGRVSKSDADLFAAQTERLIEHHRYGGAAIPATLQAWLESISENHRQQLSEIGLFKYRSSRITVGKLLDEYLAAYLDRTDIVDSTKTKIESSLGNRFGKIRPALLCSIEPKQASVRTNAAPVRAKEAIQVLAEFNSWQRNFYAPATWTRDNKLLSSIGTWAVQNGYCDFSPFADLPTASMVNDERNEYISIESATDAMESALSHDIRLTIAMGRFCGVRTCSEVRTMKWSHVDFDAGVLTIIDSKKKKPRQMPLFDTARSELLRQQQLTGKTRWVASESMRTTSSSSNYNSVKEAIRRSGQDLWPRLRQNLRSSCENDLLELFPERLVTQWLGHTVAVSREHYQKLRASDFSKAVESARQSGVL